MRVNPEVASCTPVPSITIEFKLFKNARGAMNTIRSLGVSIVAKVKVRVNTIAKRAKMISFESFLPTVILY